MDAEFWIKSWKEGRTNFNQPKPHAALLKYFPSFSPRNGQKVLVPLCGKTIDLVWLHGQGLNVHGIELYEQAVEDFFKENISLSPRITPGPDFVRYEQENLSVCCGDFFKFSAESEFDFVYDRAALVALPPSMRRDYARVITRAVKRGGKQLLIVYHYDPAKMEGPPFSIEESEVYALYEHQFKISLLESGKPLNEGARLAAVDGLKQNVYVLEKK